MRRMHVHLANGDRLSFDDFSWSTSTCGALEVLSGPNFVPEIVIAHGQWTHVKFEYVADPVPEVPMQSEQLQPRR